MGTKGVHHEFDTYICLQDISHHRSTAYIEYRTVPHFHQRQQTPLDLLCHQSVQEIYALFLAHKTIRYHSCCLKSELKIQTDQRSMHYALLHWIWSWTSLRMAIWAPGSGGKPRLGAYSTGKPIEASLCSLLDWNIAEDEKTDKHKQRARPQIWADISTIVGESACFSGLSASVFDGVSTISYIFVHQFTNKF